MRISPRTQRLLALLPPVLLLAACAGPQRPPTAPPIPGYEQLQEDLVGRDLSPLRNRRILLDPGHGGHFRGAIGPNGLTEAEVNLGVALNLRGLLEWAGAQVWLTRTANTDFLSPADSSLAGDLAMRVSMSDSLQPDVFVSIHHNSNPSLDRTINETQTYYPLDDDGASLDLARAIHRHLVTNLEIRPASIRPGNFHVLRNNKVPAVLGEPAMISHPVMAERLSLASSQRLEAEAYFLGLLDYFSGGLPSWTGAAVDTVHWGEPGDPVTLSWQFLPNGPDTTAAGAPGPDPLRTLLTLDGRPVTPRLSPDGRTVSWDLPPDLAPTTHHLELMGRNLADRATPVRRTVLLPRAAAGLAVEIWREADGRRTSVHWWGADGGPLPRGTLTLAPGEPPLRVGPDLPDRVLLADRKAGWPAAAPTLKRDDGRAGAVTLLRRPGLAADRQLRLAELDGLPFAPAQGWRGRLGADGQSPLLTVTANGPLWLEGAGVLPLVDPAPAVPAAPRTVAGAADIWPVEPILPGLLGRVIVLDPAGGGTDTEGGGPLGLRGADLNLAVAQQAAQLLRGAGAEVHLTRTDETAAQPADKVRLAGRVGADFFLTIGRHKDTEGRSAACHPGSAAGRALAAAAARAANLLPRPAGGAADTCRATESSAYLLRHTACPALEWRFDPPTSPAAELRMVRPGWQRAEARAILLAVTAVSGYPDVLAHQLQPAELLPLLAPLGGLPTAGVDWVLLDGNLAWSPLPAAPLASQSDEAVDSGTAPGLPTLLPRHTLEIHARERWQLWLLDRVGSGWEPTLLLEGPDTPQ